MSDHATLVKQVAHLLKVRAEIVDAIRDVQKKLRPLNRDLEQLYIRLDALSPRIKTKQAHLDRLTHR